MVGALMKCGRIRGRCGRRYSCSPTNMVGSTGTFDRDGKHHRAPSRDTVTGGRDGNVNTAASLRRECIDLGGD